VSSASIDYYFGLFPGLDPGARERLNLISCDDTSPDSLSEVLLRRPALLANIRAQVGQGTSSYMECFVCTELEEKLALEFGIPLYESPSALSYIGSKSAARKIFQKLDLATALGFEGIKGSHDLVNALCSLKRQAPFMETAVIKLDHGLAAAGNALFSYRDCPTGLKLQDWVSRELLNRLVPVFDSISPEKFLEQVNEGSCVVECLVGDGTKRSPSVQCQIDPSGALGIVSTHEQLFSKTGSQHFAGCMLPAQRPQYLHRAGRRVGEYLRELGVIGTFGIDFVVVEEDSELKCYAIEINLRKGGTTHHFETLKYLTGGEYEEESGRYVTNDRQIRCYYGTDMFVGEPIMGLTASEVSSFVARWDIGYSTTERVGTVLHMLDAAEPYGCLGMTCIAGNPEAARQTYMRTIQGLAELS